MVWDARTHTNRKMGVLAIRLKHAAYRGDLYLVIGRTGGEPWYIITNEKIETEEDAWRIIFIYARRWQIELCFRYGKCELSMESVRLWNEEEREKLLLMVTLVYSYLLTILHPFHRLTREWILRNYCHRTGKKYQESASLSTSMGSLSFMARRTPHF
jgi:hypothetical protein